MSKMALCIPPPPRNRTVSASSVDNSGRGNGKDNASASMAQIVASKRSENCLNSDCHIQS